MTDPRLARPLWRGRTNVDAYTIAWIERAEAIKRERWPDRPELHHQYVVIKGGYQPAADDDSSDTHTKGGGTDFTWCTRPECLLALRLAGGFAWHRTPEQGSWPHHIHGAPLGHPFMAPGLEAQERAYLSGRNGLKNNGPDDGPRLNPIPRPVWPWPEEDTVNTEDIQAIADATAKKILAAPIAADGRTVAKALRQASKAAGVADQVADRVVELLGTKINTAGGVKVSTDDLKAAVKQALREGTGD